MNLGKEFAALSDASRRRVVAELAAEPSDAERACGSFELPISKATRTHPFRVLREAGLLNQRHHGNGTSVSLRRNEIKRRLPGLLPLLVQEPQRPRALNNKPQ